MLGSIVMKAAVLAGIAATSNALALHKQNLNELIQPYKRKPLQDIVTWDEHSLFVHGERILFYSGEYHPWRLPVPGLWLDVFQKIKALGYNGVSFYTDWALLEGKPGEFSAEGIFAYEPFFEAAQEAGIYLLARPGPYINAEVSGGGFPGWLQRVPALLRTRDPAYLNATKNYADHINAIIAKAQITNGGPVILYQPENEYTGALSNVPEFPDAVYFGYIEDQARDAGIVVPFISNDASAKGYFAPGTNDSAVDIYGHDGYPLGFDCANPYTWPDNALPTSWRGLHELQSPSTPYSVVEFQGGAFDPWGGLGFPQCADLLNYEFERVFYKNLFSFGVTIYNIYMTYGGTNWGNLGHPGGYTSYDYGAVITEDRLVDREKYSEAKLEANFLQASPAYLTAIPQNNSHANGSYSNNPSIAVTALLGNITKFFIVRHAFHNTLDTTQYKLDLPTSQGNITIPQTNGSLVLNGRDSKVVVTDYDIGGTNLLYSSAEIFTWKKYGSKTVLVVYGGPNEYHELAFSQCGHARVVEGEHVNVSQKASNVLVSFETSANRRIVQVNHNVYVYILDRNSAYNYWVLNLPSNPVSGNYTNTSVATSAAIVKAGYLLRTVEVSGSTLALTGDLNATTPIEIIGGAPHHLKKLIFNGQDLEFKQSKTGVVTATAKYIKPEFDIPDLASIDWKSVDSLPEIVSGYNDSLWTNADLTYSNNTVRNLTTPKSLYSSDYGFHTGNLLYRGHFTALGNESFLYLSTQGGSAFGASAWLNSTFLGSWAGYDKAMNGNNTFTLPNITPGTAYVITVLIDNQGLDENWVVGSEGAKNPRGILNYALSGRDQSSISWKLTGNFGGEDYADKTRGPLNEGGLYIERQGWHLPGAPTSSWTDSTGPSKGIDTAGVTFYSTTFDLDLPTGYDIPLSISVSNTTSSSSTNGSLAAAFRAQIYVNGYQFGKYVNNIGPQTVFPVPEGIWNYHGSNYLGVSLWALEAGGAKLSNLSLVAGPVIQSGYGPVELSPLTGWVQRDGTY